MSGSSVHCSTEEAGPWALPSRPVQGSSAFGLTLLGWQCIPKSSTARGTCDPGEGVRAGSRVGAGSAHFGSCFRQQCRPETVASEDVAWSQRGAAVPPDLRKGSGPPSQTSSFMPLRAEGVEHDSSKRWRLFLRFSFLSVDCIPPR